MNSLEILSRVIELSNAPVDAEQRLGHLMDFLAQAFGIPFCALFLLDPGEERLSLQFCSDRHPVLPPGLSFPLQEGALGACLRQKIPVIFTEPRQFLQGSLSLPKNFTLFPFLAFFPIADEIFPYGVLGLLGDQVRQLSTEEYSLFPIICRQLAGTIRSTRVALQAKKRIAQLSTLQAISNTIISTLELGELLRCITLNSSRVLQADGAILRLLDEEAGGLKVVSAYGLEDETEDGGPPSEVPLGEDAAGIVALTHEPILIRDAQKSPYSFRKLPQKISSAICVPLTFHSKTLGTLTLFSLHRHETPPKTFDEEDRNLLMTMASQIANAIENAIILQRTELLVKDKERRVRELSLLYEISRSMHTTIKLEQLLRIILISITLGNHRGFDRAALFLFDEKENVLKGMMGVGPRSREESEQWRRKIEKTLFTQGRIVPEEMDFDPYDTQVQKVRISLDRQGSILIRTLIEMRSFNIQNAASEPGVNPRLLRWFGSRAFASVPLIAKGKAIGLMAVDNLFTERPITSEDIDLLTLLANQAAMAIENSRLYSNLQDTNRELLQAQNRVIHSEKLAALGEVVASITHEIKNPLVSIGGFARRLERSFQENSPEKKYIRIILKEVKRLEAILNETLTYSKEPPLPSGRHEINRILEDLLSTLESEFHDRDIRVTKDLAPDLPLLLCDPQQLNQVFFNLLMNAIQAIGRDGNLFVKTSAQEPGEPGSIQVEVGDSGGGIPLEVLDNIFNPFFTTKQDGTGLGLAIAHKIVTQHRGEIEVVNHPGVGATFLIRFPLSR